PRLQLEAQWYQRRALELAPEEAEAWWAQAETLERADRVGEAVQSMERAIRKEPQRAPLWLTFSRLLAKSNRPDEAIQAATKAIDLAAANSEVPHQILSQAFMQRSLLFQRKNFFGEARADYLRAKNIPPRDSATPLSLMDLTFYYNAGLEESWHNRRDWGNNLA